MNVMVQGGLVDLIAMNVMVQGGLDDLIPMNVMVQGGLVDLIPMNVMVQGGLVDLIAMNVMVQGGLVDLIPMSVMASTFILRGRCGTFVHGLSFYVAGVGLYDMVETCKILIRGVFLCWSRFGTRFSSKVSRLSVNLCVCMAVF